MEHLHLKAKISCHQNYARQLTKGIKLIPTENTLEQFLRDGIWLHQTEKTVDLYVEKTTAIEPVAFLFWIEITDPLFFNYIQLPESVINKETLLYFSNTSPEKQLVPKQENVKTIQRKLQVVVFDEPVVAEEYIEVYNNHGNLVYKEFVNKGLKSTVLDLTQEEDGMYTWVFKGFSGTFFLTDKNLTNIIGVCELQLSSGSIEKLNILFETQNTYWEYLIISKKELTEGTYTVVDEEGIYTFRCQGKKGIANTEVISFISNQKIPYKEYPQTQFKLVSNKKNTPLSYTEEDRILPNGTPEYINKYNEAEETAFKTQIILHI